MNLQITKFRKYESGALQGYADILLIDVGLTLYACTLFEKEDRSWVGLPQQKYTNKDGETKYSWISEFTKDFRDDFQSSALAAISAFRENPPAEKAAAEEVPPEKVSPPLDNDIPF